MQARSAPVDAHRLTGTVLAANIVAVDISAADISAADSFYAPSLTAHPDCILEVFMPLAETCQASPPPACVFRAGSRPAVRPRPVQMSMCSQSVCLIWASLAARLTPAL